MQSAHLSNSDNRSSLVADQQSIEALCSAAIRKMMAVINISVKDIPIPPTEVLEQSVRQTVARWNLQVKAPEELDSAIRYSVLLASSLYGYTKTDVQRQIALYNFLVLCIDNRVIDNRATEEFATRLCASKPQLDPLLDCLAEVLAHMEDYYHPYAAQAIIMSTIQAVNCNAFDKHTESMVLHSRAVSFPRYRRTANGAGEAYTFFAWDKFAFPDIRTFVQVVPDMITWLCHVNDVFSFYKEELAGERNNYMHDLSAVTGKNIPMVLFDVVEDAATVTERARAVLEGDALDVLERFMQGGKHGSRVSVLREPCHFGSAALPRFPAEAPLDYLKSEVTHQVFDNLLQGTDARKSSLRYGLMVSHSHFLDPTTLTYGRDSGTARDCWRTDIKGEAFLRIPSYPFDTTISEIEIMQFVQSQQQDNVPQAVATQQSITDISSAAVYKMLQMASISVRGVQIPPLGGVERSVREVIAGWDLQVKSSEKWESHIITALHLAVTAYGHLDASIQHQIALYTFVIFRLDDLDLDGHAAGQFATRLCTGKPQLHPLLDRLAEILGGMSDNYLPYVAEAIIVSTIRFVNSTVFDEETKSMALHDQAELFPEYRRTSNGIGEAYAFFVWDKARFPDVCSFVQAVPDMIRFFGYLKRSLQTNKNNYVHDLSMVTGKDVSAVLCDIAEDVAAIARRARAVLKGDALHALERFMQGYTMFHLICPRYKVKHFLDVEGLFDSDTEEHIVNGAPTDPTGSYQ
ncbi:hypothetical protein NM688_g2601 [Phlebia brevispora]|uniref:Uncharacterized protein n=1 Tax=Phlebia brevispora TaxID=194682 RepID=A0ACC1T864_9APHY|nr:hypothetical protein NM688_g2601 [Phlebia brevispora]